MSPERFVKGESERTLKSTSWPEIIKPVSRQQGKQKHRNVVKT